MDNDYNIGEVQRQELNIQKLEEKRQKTIENYCFLLYIYTKVRRHLMAIIKSIEEIIDKLGYRNSKELYYYEELASLKGKISLQNIKSIKEVKPYAFYCIENKPFVLFFEKINNEYERKELNKKIWNMQIPVVIFDDVDKIKIYNGSKLDINEVSIELLEEIDKKDCNEETDFSFWNIINQRFWVKYKKNYSNKKLNELMLENIKYITEQLKEKYHISYATRLILRMIFIRYLIDKEIDIDYKDFPKNINEAREKLIEITKDKKELYKLFEHLKDKFNGNLFELNNEIYDENLNDDALKLLSDFLSGKLVLNSGQISLFNMYDFNIIPVELISNIYEILLGKEVQERDKAFYTPDYLVNYIIEQSIKPLLGNSQNLKVLDPSCGSRNIFSTNF